MIRFLLAFLLLMPTAEASFKLRDLTGRDLGDVHTVVGAWTKDDEVTARLPVNESPPTTGIFCPGGLSTSESCEEFRGRIPVACTVVHASATVTTAPTGATILVDINECDSNGENCVSIWSATQANRLTIAAGAKAGARTAFDDTAIALGNKISFDIDQVGSSVAGSNLTVILVCQ